MSACLAWAVAGWSCAAAALAALLLVRRRLARCLALVAEASHELRGPLAAVQLGLSALAGDPDPARARRVAALDLQLRRAGRALSDLAEAPAGRRAPDSPGLIDVGDLLEEARDAWAPMAAAHGTTVLAEPPAEWWVVRGDRIRIAQALGNLVANALEHGRGPVRLSARLDGDRLAIEVHDAGRGLPAPLPPWVRAGRRDPRPLP